MCYASCLSPPLQVDGNTLPASLMLTVKTASGATAQGRIEAEHLADHPAAVRELREAAAVGARLGPLARPRQARGAALLTCASIPEHLLASTPSLKDCPAK